MDWPLPCLQASTGVTAHYAICAESSRDSLNSDQGTLVLCCDELLGSSPLKQAPAATQAAQPAICGLRNQPETLSEASELFRCVQVGLPGASAGPRTGLGPWTQGLLRAYL